MTACHLKGVAMFALFTEVNAEKSDVEGAREILPKFAVPGARAMGAKDGYWLAPVDGRAVAVVVFETEAEARKAAEQFKVGEPPMPNAPGNVTVRTVEVREVLASM
jgi:hypothetical protein